MILAAQHIRHLCISTKRPLFDPYSERMVDARTGTSYGLSSAGYDVRLDQSVVIMPGEFRLASTMESVDIPPNLLIYVKDKSSLIRRGLTLGNTILDPGFRGYVTLELFNHGIHNITLPEGAPIAQFVMHQLLDVTEEPYSGKYQDQKRGPVEALREEYGS